jgi:hypothetical protein
MNLAKLPMRDVSYTLEFPNPFAVKDRPSIAVAKAPDHSTSFARSKLYVKHTTRGIKGEARVRGHALRLQNFFARQVAMRIAHRHLTVAQWPAWTIFSGVKKVRSTAPMFTNRLSF